MTIDHFQPQSKGGSDKLNNLIYCCNSCNSYKSDYYPTEKSDPIIWNPRVESFDTHSFMLQTGILTPLTGKGKSTIELLRLNRSPLISYRLKKKERMEERRLLEQYQNLTNLFHQANQELSSIVKNQQELLELQQQLLRFLLDDSAEKE